MKSQLFILILSFSISSVISTGQQKGLVQGKVFFDRNSNGIFDEKEKGIDGILVSNGTDIVKTNKNGEWEIVKRGNEPVFIIKPAGFSVPVNHIQIPQHFIPAEENSSSKFNFPLVPQNEKGKFKALFFGDTQARGMKEVNYIFHDVVEELIGTEAVFGVSLGDIVADDPELMDDVAAGIAQIGIPWYNIFGNHDNDRQAKTNDERDETFEKFFGPSTYAFEYGEVAFIALNNIYFNPDEKYKSHFTEEQLEFVENYLRFVPNQKLVVLMMHSPIVACDNKEEMYRLLEKHENTFSISGHAHEQINLFIDEKMGWQGKTPHHHLINATVCGSWWCGLKDETGIPHATMNDGAPNGYSVITFDGSRYSIRFKAARKPAGYQMNIYLPDELPQPEADTTRVLVNVFAGSVKSKVVMSIDNGDWIVMDTIQTVDPEYLRMYNLSPFLDENVNGQPLEDILGYKMDYPSVSHHIWKAKLPGGIKSGTHKITVRTTDIYNQTFTSNRIFRVK